MVKYTTRHEFLQGKSQFARLRVPDTAFGQAAWKVRLYLTPDSLKKVMELKEEGILNIVGRDEDGYYINIRRNTTMKVKGADVALNPPIVLDGTKGPNEDGTFPLLPADVEIGNGSDITVKIVVYKYNPKFGSTSKQGTAIRLESVRVDTLVPFVPIRDFNENEIRQTKGLEAQPEQPQF